MQKKKKESEIKYFVNGLEQISKYFLGICQESFEHLL